jgi:hypothetical protein
LPPSGDETVTQEDFASGTEQQIRAAESARRMAVSFRIAVLVLTLADFLGLILDSVISYTPTFPIVVLVNSLICLIAGTRANVLSRGTRELGGAVGGLAYSAVVGGGIMFLFSGFAAIAGAVGAKGSIAGQHGSLLLLNLSWPAAVISLVAIGIGITAFRRIKKVPR